MAGQNHRSVRNRETLIRLDGGMEIVRATKHEPIELEAISPRQLARSTDSVNGSQFNSQWPLERVTDWLCIEIEERGWRFPPGVNARVRVVLDEPVGISEGKVVHTITILASGRYVHAYPDKDRR